MSPPSCLSYFFRSLLAVHHGLKVSVQNIPYSVGDVRIVDLALLINIGVVVEVLSDLIEFGKVNIADVGQSPKA